MKLKNLFVVAASLALTGGAMAQANQVAVGSNAPRFQVEHWIKGDAFTIEPGNVYVIEFWATWCGPCVRAIPHLTKLQKQYADDGLIILGVSTDREKDTVTNFVRQRGDQIGYHIAWDSEDRMKGYWFDPAGLRGIPASFIVDRQGKIQYIGNPHDPDFDTVLALVVGGRFDAKLYKEALPVLREIESHRKVRNWQLANKLLDDLIAVDPKAFSPFALMKFEILLIDMDDQEEAYRYARRLMVEYADDAGLLAALAVQIASDPKIPAEKRDLEVAMQAVNLAARIAGSNDHRMLAHQALVNFHAGNVSEAISLQRRAWMIAAPNRKANLERVLREYQSAEQREARLN